MYSDDDMFMLFGILHFRFCPRQWALIHIEQQWADNRLTIEGQIIHKHVDAPFYRQKCGEQITLRAVNVASHELGLYGVSDVIELLPSLTSENTILYPKYPGKWRSVVVEYKHGKPKRNEVDEVQLAAQIMRMEEIRHFFHTLRPGRVSLALDMMEELRAYLEDRFVLSFFNKRQVTAKDFLFQGDNGIVMTDKGKKTFIVAWQGRIREMIIHPYLNEKVEIGLLPYIQAMLMARYIRQDIDSYPVFLIK